MTRRVGLASCKRLPEPDPDQELLCDALARAGMDPRILAWDDDDALSLVADQRLVVLRSTWNYFERHEAFVDWADRASRVTRLFNPSPVVAWNAEKTYLSKLAERGVEIVPTEIVARGETRRLAEILDARGWDEVVIKPVVSAGSFRTERFARSEIDEGERFLSELVRDRATMVQKWMASVQAYGERSLVWIDGALTHAIRKSPRFAGGHEEVSSEVPIAADEAAFAERAVAPFAHDLLYARIDMVRDETSLRIMELELIEPSLFLAQAPRALERLVEAIDRRCK
ncbi:MAG: hypothetical protein KF819_15615 [Labilithrix sp.]|nr:hypothetical protein [Labilithrix sp.]